MIGSQSQEKEYTGLYKRVDLAYTDFGGFYCVIFFQDDFDVSYIGFLTMLKCCVLHTFY